MSHDVFAALADETRREILRLVADRSLAAGEIAARFPQQRPAISKHISALKDAGLLLEQRDRQKRIYSLNRAGLDPLAGLVRQLHPGPMGTGSLQVAPIYPVAGLRHSPSAVEVGVVEDEYPSPAGEDRASGNRSGLDLDFD